MASIGGIRSGARVLMTSAAISKSGTRELHATAERRMGGHGHDEPYYMHAKHMYNLDRMKFRKLTVSLSVLAAFSIGVAVPVYVVIFQQRKAVSG